MSTDSATLLVVDPEPAAGERLAQQLRLTGATVSTCAGGADALEVVNQRPVDVVLAQMSLLDMSALQLLVALSERWPGLPVIVYAAAPNVSELVALLKAGAADFIEQPFDADEIAYVAEKALAAVRARAPRPPPPGSDARASILGDSNVMRRATATLRRAAEGTSTVLIRGESGTGKELVARAIHEASPRARQPFIKIDCASLPESLMESELFGYEKGAFTGAASRKPGRIELADKGTLFLDEIGELGPQLQAKLLRLLQDRQLERLGGTKLIPVDVRVLAATHRDLEAMIDRSQFRLDLFYRLNVIPLWLPPLRARRDDIELLAAHFALHSGAANGRPGLRFDEAAMRLLRSQRWPGNVRQLQNFVERMSVLASAQVVAAREIESELTQQVRFKTESAVVGLAPGLQPAERVGDSVAEPALILPLDHAVRAAEKQILERALRSCSGNRSKAARLLAVSRSTLYAKLREHGLLENG